MNLDRRLIQQARETGLYITPMVAVALLLGVVLVLQAFFLSQVVDLVFLGGRTLAGVLGQIYLLVALILARSILVYLRDLLASRAAIRIKTGLRERLFTHLLELGPLYVRGERTGELANTAVEGIESLDGYFSQYLPSLVVAAAIPITILAFVFPLDLLSGAIFLLTAPLIPLFMVLIGKAAEALTRRQWRALSRMSAHFLDVLQGLTTLKLLGRSREQARTIREISDRHREATLAVLRVAFLSGLALELLATMSTAIVAVEVGLRLLGGHIPFQQAFFVLLLAPEYYLPLRNLGSSFHAGVSGMAAAQRLFAILETGPTASPPPSLPVPASPTPHSLRFEEVRYSYEGGKRPALQGVSFEVGSGEMVALVGPSGSGKSTLAHLLLRFLEPQGGRIVLDGVPLNETPAEGWRRQVAWVPQTPYLFQATIEENLRMAKPEATRQEIEEAARAAMAHEFIERLPQGYGTAIGERGVRLSGGQAQRLAIARAFLKDAPILILDEATSHLDAELETKLERSLERLRVGRTVLVITHRLAAARRADWVVVLDQGRVVGAGTHTELMHQDGLYRGLVEAGEGVRREIAWEYGGSQPAPFRDREESLASLLSSAALRNGGSARSFDPRGTLLRLLRLAAPFRGRIALSALLGFATVGSGIGLMATAAFLIASAALHPSVADLALPIVGVRFFGLSRGVFRYLERYVSHGATLRLLERLRVWFYEKVETLVPRGLLQQHSGDLLIRAVADVETLQHFFVRVMIPSVVALLVALAAGLFLGGFDPALAALLLLSLLLSGLIVPLGVERMSHASGRTVAILRADMTARLVDGIQGMPDLMALGRTEDQLERLRELGRRWAGLQERMSRITGLHGALGTLLTHLGTLAVLVAAIPLATGGRMDGLYLPVVGLVALASFEAVIPLPQAFQHLSGCLQSAQRLFEIADSGRENRETERCGDGGTGGSMPAVSTRRSGAGTVHPLVLRGLRFRYGPGEPWVLDDVSFDLKRGQRLAITGPSGCGKSTLIHLLLRLWEYEDGTVLLDGRDLMEYSPQELRQRIAVVPQRTDLFCGTLRENVLITKPGASDRELAEAVARAGLEPLLKSLPDGWDSWIGEHGLRLSGGERQRVSLARAFLQDAPTLLLDEAAANLDGLSERDIWESLGALGKSHSALVVTHHLAGLEMADEVMLMKQGRIVARKHPSTILERI